MMKRLIALIACLMLAVSAAAFVQAEEPNFLHFESMEWTFASGAGGWSNDLKITGDGSFVGVYHDSEMGEVAKAYPDGTIYYCTYSGKLSLGEQIDEYSWKMRVDTLSLDGEPDEETIEEGIRFVNTVPYGIEEGDELILYRPGTPVSALPEEMLLWAHVYEEQRTALGNWFLCNLKQDSGFLAYVFDDMVSLANPWLDMTEEELIAASGIGFAIPEDAEEVTCRYLPGEALSEIQFTLDGDEYCARIEPAALNAGELMNISDIYLAFENEEKVTIAHCEGTIGLARTGSEDWVELCLWYDIAPGIMYSLSVYTTDPDGLDLTAVAEQVYVPMQGDA